jgi:uncharacterized protein (TIGR03083 family)
MEATAIQHDVFGFVEVLVQQTATLVRNADPAAMPANLRWSVREVAAHLISATNLYTELAMGAGSPLTTLTPEALSEFNDQRIADVADTDPERLGALVMEASAGFLDTARTRPDAQVRWHAGINLDMPQLASVLLGEYLLHGLDIASGVGAPWPIDPRHAALVLYGYGPVLPACADPTANRGHSASYRLDLGTAGSLAVRFMDGRVTVRPADDDAYDCMIVAEPTAFLLVSTGRMLQSTAIALRLMGAQGQQPELGLSFGSRFRYP